MYLSKHIHKIDEIMEQSDLIELKLVCLDKSTIDVEVSALPFKFKEKASVQVVFRNITERNMITKKLKETNELLKQLSTKDGLTHVANRRSIAEYLEQEWKRSIRNSTPISLILLDIDFFKLYNDTYGHQAGNACLKMIAVSLKNTVKRSGDLVARYGGEEFVVVLPNTNMTGAASVAEDLRENTESLQIPHLNSKVSQYVTVSIGIAATIPPLDSNPFDLLNQADKALYMAKQEGRNRVKFYE
jgi:diguanylate cyclase (GGDEF)-like protein